MPLPRLWPPSVAWLLLRAFLGLSLFASSARPARAREAKPPPPQTIVQLQMQIETILRRTHTPGAGVALVRRGGSEWVAGLGLANVAAQTPATADTLFRIGSVSKGFVSLSILKLQAEGRLNLQDTLRSRAPDLEFFNPWEATDPVRIVHLLEHTAGWDDLGLSEFALNRWPELSLREGLAFRPRTRTSRWRPGTRYSYSNAGPSAAAYIIEKVTGQRFEDYVEKTWFQPLHMDTAGYLDTPEGEHRRATLYHQDGKTPFPYWHLSLRPAGSINASAREMAHYVEFYLKRGAYAGVQLLPAAALDRMETPTSTYAAREGMKTGYGLGNNATVRNRWVFHGHNGGVFGGLTELAYLPEAGVGYVLMINSGNAGSLNEISALLRDFVTRSLPKPALPKAGAPSALGLAYAGWYEPVSPRAERTRFLARILGLTVITADRGYLWQRGLFSRRRAYVPVSDRLFRREGETVPTLALIADVSEGTLVQTSAETFRRVPSWLPWLEFTVMAAALLLAASSLAFALVWVPRKVFGDLRSVGFLWVRALPALAALLLLLCFLFLLAPGGENPVERLGTPTFWSVGLFLASLAFAACAVLGLLAALLHRNRGIPRLVWWHAFAASVLLTVVAAYLTYWGVVGARLWD